MEHDHDARRAAALAVRHLVETQSRDGSWRFEDYGDTHHTWLTGQILVALQTWRNAQPDQVSRSLLRDAADLTRRGIILLRRHIIGILLGVVLVRLFLHDVTGLAVQAGEALGIDHASMANNLLASAIWLACTAAVAALIALIRGPR